MEGHYDAENYEGGIKFEDLPVDVLLNILKYLNISTLSSLCLVSKRLYNIINDEYLNFKSYSLLVTNQFSVEIQQKSLKTLSSISKYRTNFLWRRKCYQEGVYLKTKEKYRPWLSLKKNCLYISRGTEIFSYERNYKGICNKPNIVYKGHLDDISRFVVRDNVIISGGSDGKISCWDISSAKEKFSVSNSVGWNESLYVDSSSGTVACGFNLSGCVKFWGLDDEKLQLRKEFQTAERVWSLALNGTGDLCAIGSDGFKASPLHIYDLNRENLNSKFGPPEGFKTGAGVFDIIWESPQVLLTGGFDTYVRMWDTRTEQCVKSWSDPYDAAIYSLATDYYWTIMAGTAVHGRVTLWDKRVSNCIQMYFMSKSRGCGPVYSLDFDPCYMFVLLDSSLHILDFSVSKHLTENPWNFNV